MVSHEDEDKASIKEIYNNFGRTLVTSLRDTLKKLEVRGIFLLRLTQAGA